MTWLEVAAILLMQTAAQTGVSGRVVSAATGEPVSGAQVTIVPAAPGPGGAGRIVTGSVQGVIGGGPLPVPIPLPDFAGRISQIPQTTTSTDGRFSFQKLTPGTYQLT